MKPLTIEELKILKVGDWVWEDKSKVYEFIKDKTDNFLLVLCDGVLDRHYYSDYGKTWLAYKNKEQAETKGEIVELPCKLGQKLYAIDDGAIREYFAGEVNVCEDGRFVFETPKLFPHRLIFGEDIFIDKNEAEEYFAQIKGKDK